MSLARRSKYDFDEGLEKRLEDRIDEELAKSYSDEEVFIYTTITIYI